MYRFCYPPPHPPIFEEYIPLVVDGGGGGVQSHFCVKPKLRLGYVMLSSGWVGVLTIQGCQNGLWHGDWSRGPGCKILKKYAESG